MALPTRVNRMQGQGYDPIESAQRDFENVLGRFFGGRELNEGFAPYGVDVREDADHIYVEAELPGYKKEEVDITLENQTLTISAEKNEEDKKEQKGQLLLNERRYSRFLRSFTLPPTVNEQSVKAQLNDGVLSITLDKREETKPRKIQVG